MITPDKLKTARNAVLIGGLDLLVTFASFIAARSSVLLADFLKTFGGDFRHYRSSPGRERGQNTPLRPSGERVGPSAAALGGRGG